MEQPADGERIAIIDDDERLLAALRRFLAARGYAVDTFRSAEQYIEKTRPHVRCVLSDVNLMGWSGIQLAQYLRAVGSSLPVILMSANDDQKARRNAQAAGCTDYLVKPISGPDLLAALRRATTADAGREPAPSGSS